MLAVGDGALGFWKAIRDVFPDTKEQRCWWHKIGNCLPRSRVGVPGRERLWPRSTTPRVISKQPDQGGHETGRHVGQRELPGQVRLLDGGCMVGLRRVGCMVGLRHAGWASR